MYTLRTGVAFLTVLNILVIMGCDRRDDIGLTATLTSPPMIAPELVAPWDGMQGSSPLPLEGTWRLIEGQYYPTGLAYFPFWIEVWGDAIIGLGGGHFKVEGYRGFSRYGEVPDTTYFDYVVEEGSYTLDGSAISIVIPSLWDSLMVGLTTAQYDIIGDTLTLSYGPDWCGSWDQYYMEGN